MRARRPCLRAKRVPPHLKRRSALRPLDRSCGEVVVDGSLLRLGGEKALLSCFQVLAEPMDCQSSSYFEVSVVAEPDEGLDLLLGVHDCSSPLQNDVLESSTVWPCSSCKSAGCLLTPCQAQDCPKEQTLGSVHNRVALICDQADLRHSVCVSSEVTDLFPIVGVRSGWAHVRLNLDKTWPPDDTDMPVREACPIETPHPLSSLFPRQASDRGDPGIKTETSSCSSTISHSHSDKAEVYKIPDYVDRHTLVRSQTVLPSLETSGWCYCSTTTTARQSDPSWVAVETNPVRLSCARNYLRPCLHRCVLPLTKQHSYFEMEILGLGRRRGPGVSIGLSAKHQSLLRLSTSKCLVGR